MLRILQIVGGLALIVGFAWLLSRIFAQKPTAERPPSKRDPERGSGEVIATIAIVVLLILGLGACAAFESVPAGHVGVKVNFGEVDVQHPYPEGLSFVMPPWADLLPVDVRIQKCLDAADFSCASKDMQDVHVKLAVNARPDREKAPRLYQEIGMEYMDKVLAPAAAECLKAEMANHSASDILANRSVIKGKVQAGLTAWVKKYGIDVLEMSIVNIGFDQQYEGAIKAKQVEEQKALQKVYELQRTEKEAEMAKAKASGEAEAAIQAARGKAEAVKLEADANAYSVEKRAQAESEANRKIAASLATPEGVRVIDLQRVQRWDGKLPGFMGGGVVPFLDVTQAAR